MAPRFDYTITDATGAVTTRSITAPDLQCAKRKIAGFNKGPHARGKTYRLIKPKV